MEIENILKKIKEIEADAIDLMHAVPAGARMMAPALFNSASKLRGDLTAVRLELQTIRNSEALKNDG